ncbi:carbamoyltransferase HypF [Thalassoroseus pseudoceratinae]|uniref:carbamoyltransferase HypF n=1 Tax=Thalassoroseus pseudoceratinae TaxID=2713176 RepID=UPI00197D1AB1|nr:carbamoyltransferase HypF [Thalassoroseus pseudoceratinae]
MRVNANMQRHEIIVRGIVQGVGFRPFVHALASRFGLSGRVLNDSGVVKIEVEGETNRLDGFFDELVNQPPPLTRILSVSREQCPPIGQKDFRIEHSQTNGPGVVLISADVATCDDCLRELFDPADRRFRYPFLNCTNCGPRLTITQSAPYDRCRTTMSRFSMCPDCHAEYTDPRNRRFHAQPIACPVCGPRLSLRDVRGKSIECHDPLLIFVKAIKAGKIGAVKGLGGYHLVCDASNEATVQNLRTRKSREEKPLAVMAANLAVAKVLCHVSQHEQVLLKSPARPIVLLQRRQQANAVADSVALGNSRLGVMLPYTPLHHLLMSQINALVMTSGNRSNEPIVTQDADAITRLAGIADVFLVHNRPIHVRCDDSVVKVVSGVELPVRRSRGYAPKPIPLPVQWAPPILAVGGKLKNTFALGCGDQGVLSHHLGDLDYLDAYQTFQRDVLLYQQLFDVQPEWIAHDLHPEYASTRFAAKRFSPEKLIGVQHHHAHMAACMAENGLSEPVIGVIFDGTGYGTDGAIWGGEFFIGDYNNFERAAHLRHVTLPGGDAAVREPWRMALSHAMDAGCECPAESFFPTVQPSVLRIVETMIRKNLNSPMTSSMGRLIDAVAAICGVGERNRFEGQAAMALEDLASDQPDCGCYEYGVEIIDQRPATVDTRPLIRGIIDDNQNDVQPSIIARRFHSTVAEIIVSVCRQLRKQCQLNRVVLSGGVFLNALLTEESAERLINAGFDVYRHSQVPPGDGGLSLGQLTVAAARLQNFRVCPERCLNNSQLLGQP